MTDLFLYDQNFDEESTKKIANSYNICDIKDIIPIKSWESLAKNIKDHKNKIEHLVLYFHGFDGGLVINGDARNLSEDRIKKLFSEGASMQKPKATRISFIGCNVGKKPSEMVAFGKILGAKEVSGYTWFIIIQKDLIKIYKSTDEKSIKKKLEPFADYSIENLSDSANLASISKSREQTLNIILRYASREWPEHNLKIPFQSGDRIYSAMNKVDHIKIIEQNAKQTQDQIQNDPVMPFQLITVTIEDKK